MCHLISKLIAVRLEKHVNPSDMMLCGVGVGNFFADGHLDLEHVVGFHGIRAFNDGNALFALSISGLIQFSDLHTVSSSSRISLLLKI